jgi:hypothetical protein
MAQVTGTVRHILATGIESGGGVDLNDEASYVVEADLGVVVADGQVSKQDSALGPWIKEALPAVWWTGLSLWSGAPGAYSTTVTVASVR